MLNLLSSTPEYSNLFVVCMGVGTVFVGLIVIIFCCKLMSLFMKNRTKEETLKAQTNVSPVPSAQTAPIQNKQELVAAISAAVAENLGRDVSAIRIVSIKRV